MNALKRNNSAGPHGLFTESFIFGGLRLSLHFSSFLLSSIHDCYLPNLFIESVIIPIVKIRMNEDPIYVNNYRAIAIAEVKTKLLETILLNKIRATS